MALPNPLSSRALRARRRFSDVQETLLVPQNPHPSRRRDWAFAALFALLGILEALGPETIGAARGWEVAALLPAVASVPFRRSRPPHLIMISLVVMMIGSAVLGDGLALPGGVFLSLAFSIYSLCRWQLAGRVYAGVAAVLVLEPVAEFLRSGRPGDSVASFTLWMVVIAAGIVMRYRRILQLNQIEQVRLGERNVLARELHDSVAHYVSAIAVQAQAAQYVAKTDPEAAVNAMAEVEQTANRAIDEMQRMVGVLRTTDDIARTVASTSLHDLVDPTMQPVVTVFGDHDLSALSPTIAAATFRVAQESVTNARRHGRSATFIQVNAMITATEVVLQVSNDGVARLTGRTGYGLVGMEERVASVGGQITAGPAPQNRWIVEARIPLQKVSGE